MALNWIKWVKGLVRRREILAVANKLGTDRRIAACLCMELWEWADENTIDGHVEGVTAGDIDGIVAWDGFSLAVESVGWLRIHEGGCSFPRWDRHNGKSAKRRALSAERTDKSRKKKALIECNASVTPVVTSDVTLLSQKKLPSSYLISSDSDSTSKLNDFDEGILPEAGFNWLVIEAQFVARWNSLPGVAKCSRGIPGNLTLAFREKWSSSEWRALLDQALAKFPLKNGSIISLKKFLEDSTMDEILGGVHDWSKNKSSGQPQQHQSGSRRLAPGQF
jgi:hypothetical protein